MELEVVNIKIIDGRFVVDWGENGYKSDKQLEPIKGNTFQAIVFAEQDIAVTNAKTVHEGCPATQLYIRLWIMMQVEDEIVLGILVVPKETMKSWADYKARIEKNQLTLETINTIFMLNEMGDVIVTMARLAHNEVLILVKKAYAQVEHLLNVPEEVEVNV